VGGATHAYFGHDEWAAHAPGLKDLLAWWFWRTAHVFFLIGFRNRVSVPLNWALAYWTYQRGARIVLGQDRAAEHPP
jgi:NADH dehydrogenase